MKLKNLIHITLCITNVGLTRNAFCGKIPGSELYNTPSLGRSTTCNEAICEGVKLKNVSIKCDTYYTMYHKRRVKTSRNALCGKIPGPRLGPYMIEPTRLGPHYCAHTRLCPDTIVSTHVCAHTRLCPHTIVPRHVCAQTRLCPHMIVPTHGCAQTRLCPHTIVPTHVCAQTRLCPHTIVPRHICALICYAFSDIFVFYLCRCNFG